MLRHGIQTRCRFIHNQQPRASDYRRTNHQTLGLAARQFDTVLPNNRIETMRQPFLEVDLQKLHQLPQLGIGNLNTLLRAQPVSQVISNGTVKYLRLLRNVADAPPPGSLTNGSQIDAVDQNATGCWIIESQ